MDNASQSQGHRRGWSRSAHLEVHLIDTVQYLPIGLIDGGWDFISPAAVEKALQWIILTYQCSLCGRHFFPFQWRLSALFETADILPARGEIELALNWPYRIDGGCCLQLIMRGQIVRLEPGKVAMRSTSYEFRTAARTTFHKTER